MATILTDHGIKWLEVSPGIYTTNYAGWECTRIYFMDKFKRWHHSHYLAVKDGARHSHKSWPFIAELINQDLSKNQLTLL